MACSTLPGYPVYDSDSWPCAFMGFTMMQNRLAVPAWSYVAERLQPKTIVELGTHEGGFSVCMAIIARNIGARFITVDRGLPNPRWEWWFKTLEIEFHQLEVFSQECSDLLTEAIQSDGRAFVLCDNGNKIGELEMCAPMLKEGDVIGLHDLGHSDWWMSTEISQEVADPIAAANNLQPFMQSTFSKAVWLTYSKGLIDL